MFQFDTNQNDFNSSSAEKEKKTELSWRISAVYPVWYYYYIILFSGATTYRHSNTKKTSSQHLVIKQSLND